MDNKPSLEQTELDSDNTRTSDDTDNEPRSGAFGWIKSLFPPKQDTTIREVIEELIEENDLEDTPSVASHERMLIANILSLRDIPVIDVMVPRADIVAIDVTMGAEELFTLLSEKPHSRLPVFEKDMDNIIGAIHMKDVLAHAAKHDNFQLKDMLRNVLIVSPAMQVLDLLLQMRQSKVHIAMVVDEFGGIDGLITINELIEAIVGEINDEHDLDTQPQMIARADGTVLVDARFRLDDFEKRFGLLWSEEEHKEFDTLGGLVSHLAGHLPTRGETIDHPTGICFEIVDADPRRINRLRVRQIPESDPLDLETS